MVPYSHMDLQTGKAKFIQTWGQMGSSWGVTRTMGQIHALLLVSTDPLSADDVMAELGISRGNVNTNMRMLVDWGLAHKQNVPGERREFFVGEKDMSKVIKSVIVARKKRELEPLIQLLEEIKRVEGPEEETEEFRRVIGDLNLYSRKADAALDALARADSHWLFSTFLNMIK